MGYSVNLVPRVFPAFKMAAERSPGQTPDHVTLSWPITEPGANLKQSKSPIFLETCDLDLDLGNIGFEFDHRASVIDIL